MSRWEIRMKGDLCEVICETLVTGAYNGVENIKFTAEPLPNVIPMVDYDRIITLKDVTYNGVTFYNASLKDRDGRVLKHDKGALSPEDALKCLLSS